MYHKYWKRFFDFIFAFVGLLILAVPILIIALIIKATSPKPVFFAQDRVGRGGRIFRVIKFRTMKIQEKNTSSITIAGDKRVTPIGRFLRRWKLDEIPQLWNVLPGEMSFVGPRPDVPGYADRLMEDDRRVLLLRPGITGPSTLKYANEEEILAQVEDPVRFNDEVIFPDKVRINLGYLDNCSFKNDLFYIWETILLILKNK